MDYDVFISCKSEDYKYAEIIYEYLKRNDISVFLASIELRQMGESEYRRAISKAMKSTYHLIVFASKADYIDSTWVFYEWDMFLNAKLKGRKQGQILTILKDVDIDDINMDLWKYESFSFDSFRGKILSYVETPNSKLRKEQAKRKAQEEAEKRKEQEQAERRLNQIKKDINDREAEYYRIWDSLNHLSQGIIELRKEIGVNRKACPICHEMTFIDSKYCRKCGWTFMPTFSVKTSAPEEQMFIARGNWKTITDNTCKENVIQKESDSRKYQQAILEIRHLKEENERLIALNKALENLCGANIKDFIAPENLEKISDIANSTMEVGNSVFNKVAQALLTKPIKTSSNNTSKVFQDNTSCKLNKWNLVDAILKSCSYPMGSVFGTDTLNKVGFNELKFREIMETTYGISFRTNELSICKTVNSLKEYLAQKANIKID